MVHPEKRNSTCDSSHITAAFGDIVRLLSRAKELFRHPLIYIYAYSYRHEDYYKARSNGVAYTRYDARDTLVLSPNLR